MSKRPYTGYEAEHAWSLKWVEADPKRKALFDCAKERAACGENVLIFGPVLFRHFIEREIPVLLQGLIPVVTIGEPAVYRTRSIYKTVMPSENLP